MSDPREEIEKAIRFIIMGCLVGMIIRMDYDKSNYPSQAEVRRALETSGLAAKDAKPIQVELEAK